MANKFKIPDLINKVDFAINDAIAIVARDAEAHFKKSFANQGFTDETFHYWDKRKNQIRTNGFFKLKYNHVNTKPTLVKTGALKNSLKTSLRRNIAIISSSLPYSAIHNEGLMGKAWGKYPFKMPKRQFMGNSKSLERRSQAKFIAKINTAILNNK